MKWENVRRLHEETARAVIDAAEAIPAEQWLTPREAGKWSPAEILHHLVLTFDTLQRELDGGTGMAIMTRLWQRILLRVFLVPKLLRGGAFPRNARAPRELRPTPPAGTKSEAIAKFRARAAEFEAVAHEAQKRPRGGILTHAYFGRSSVANGVLLCTRHMQHHQRQLASDSQRLPAG